MLNAQPVDYDKIIPPYTATDLNFSERLVQLAWQNFAANRSFEIEVLSAEKSIKLAKLGWLDLVSMNLNVNSRTLETFGQFRVIEGDNQFFPWYNVGISLSPSIFFQTPANVELARFTYEQSQVSVNAQKLRIRAETLTRYEVYKHNLEVVKAITESFEIANSGFILIRERFNRGDATMGEFNEANAAKIGALTGKMGAELQFNLAKISLEELIGMKLEEVAR